MSTPDAGSTCGTWAKTRTLMFEEALAADNFCLEGAQRPEATVAFHICRGNNQSKWYAKGSYEAIEVKQLRSSHDPA